MMTITIVNIILNMMINMTMNMMMSMLMNIMVNKIMKHNKYKHCDDSNTSPNT